MRDDVVGVGSSADNHPAIYHLRLRSPELPFTLAYAAPEPLLSGVRDREEFGVFLFSGMT